MRVASPPVTAHYPHPAPIDAYGNGGFRFADMSHRGAILCLPSGIWGWAPRTVEEITLESLEPVLAEAPRIGHLLLGTGVAHTFPSHDIRRAVETAGIALEPMATGAAARTYNILLGEGRRVAAALLPVG